MATFKYKDLETGEWFAVSGAPGPAGSTPVKGVDYFTEEDKAEIATAIIKAGGQPDWNQNDPEAPDYVKNRPGGYVTKLEDILDYANDGVAVFDNVTYEFTDGAAQTFFWPYEWPNERYDMICRVVWDGVSYDAVSTDANRDIVALSGISPFEFSYCNTGRGAGIEVYAYDTDGNLETGTTTHTFTVYEVTETSVPIDEKLLPDTIARTTDIPVVAQADWAQNDESAPDYVKNRTHYNEITRAESLAFKMDNLANVYGGEGLLTPNGTEVEDYWEFYGSHQYVGVFGSDSEGDADLVGMGYGGSTPCVVVWDGVRYETMAQSVADSDVYEDVVIGGKDTPFIMVWGYNNKVFYKKIWVYANDAATEHSFEIYNVEVTETVKTIDEKFLPDSVKVQPDWDQNDETAPDYVKNRPGGYYGEFYDGEKVFEGTVAFAERNTPGVYEAYGLDFGFDGLPKYCKIYVGEEGYELKNRGSAIFGNESLLGDDGEDTGEPVCITINIDIDTGEWLSSIYTTLTGEEHEIYIYSMTADSWRFSEDFMPLTMAKMTDVNTAVSSHNTGTRSHSDIRTAVSNAASAAATAQNLANALARFQSDLGNEYMWEKKIVQAGYEKVETPAGVQLCTFANQTYTVQYSDGVDVDKDTGVVSLAQPVTTISYTYSTFNSVAGDVIKGKYLICNCEDYIGNHGEGGISFVPTDAEYGYSNGRAVQCSGISITSVYNVSIESFGYVNSPDPNAYPIDDGYTYTPLGQLGDKTRIATGSYTGTDTYGASNPCSLTLEFEPKLIIINGYYEYPTRTDYRSFALIAPHVGFCTQLWMYDDSSFSPGVLFSEVSGNTISWYNDNSAANQQNASIGTYFYWAFG